MSNGSICQQVSHFAGAYQPCDSTATCGRGNMRLATTVEIHDAGPMRDSPGDVVGAALHRFPDSL